MGRVGEALRGGRPAVAGAAAATALLGVFFGVVTWGNSLPHAFELFSQIWYWILLLVSGFGVQVGFYCHIRSRVRQRLRGATAEVATTGGISTGSMLACCAHYVANVLPVMGLSAAAVFLAKYQTSFLVLGAFSNLVGITFLLYFMQKHGLMPGVFASGAVARCNMKWVRNLAILLSAAAVSLSFLFAAFE